MAFHCIAAVLPASRKLLIPIFTATLLAVPSMAQQSAEEVRRLSNDSETASQRLNATLPSDSAAWGVLAKLTGNRWQTADGVIREFAWSSDGREIVESELVGGLPKPANV